MNGVGAGGQALRVSGERAFPAEGTIKYKTPEAGTGQANWRKNKRAGEAGTEKVRVKERSERREMEQDSRAMLSGRFSHAWTPFHPSVLRADIS